MVQRSLVPWLRGVGPHKFYKSRTSARRRLRGKAPPLTGLLPSLPYHSTFVILAFVGHVKDDNGDQLAVIVDEETENATMEVLSERASHVQIWIKTSPAARDRFHSRRSDALTGQMHSRAQMHSKVTDD